MNIHSQVGLITNSSSECFCATKDWFDKNNLAEILTKASKDWAAIILEGSIDYLNLDRDDIVDATVLASGFILMDFGTYVMQFTDGPIPHWDYDDAEEADRWLVDFGHNGVHLPYLFKIWFRDHFAEYVNREDATLVYYGRVD